MLNTSSNPLPFSLTRLLGGEGEWDMRKVGVQAGRLWKQGPSWLVEFREYAKDETGKVVAKRRCERVGPAIGPGRLTKQEAQREANTLYLNDINRRNLKPSSSMLVSDFIETRFMDHVVSKRKPSGRKHYEFYLRRHILPKIGERRLCDIDVDAAESMLAEISGEGLSWQTVKHARNVGSRIIRLAKKLRLYHDENPFRDVEEAEKPVIRKRPGYTWQQAAQVLAKLPSPVNQMAKLSIATSMNVAEMCGVRLKWCNFTPNVKEVEGEVLAPFCIGVRENFYGGEYGTLKAGKRLRNVSITPALAAELESLVAGGKYQGPEDPLFPSRTGKPIDPHNVANRKFKPLSLKLGFPVTWHGFRRAHSTFVGQLENVSLEDRVKTMGHAEAAMTLYYSIEDVERRRAIPAGILERLEIERERAEKVVQIKEAS